MTLTPRQAEVNRTLGKPQRHTLLVGGSRSGKTFLLVRAVLIRALRAPNSRHAIVRFRYNAIRASIWLDTLPKVAAACFPRLKLNYRERDGYVELPNGSQIWIAGLDDKERVEKILGQEYATMYFNECSQLPWASVTTALTRLAQKCDGLANRAYYDLNPTGTGHWSYRLFIEKRSPDSLEALAHPEDYAHEYLNPNDNRANVDAAYLESLAALPERQRKRFFEGRYVAQLDGALWTLELIEQNRVSREDVPELQRIVVAIDPSGASGQFDLKADEIGIVAVGRGRDGHGYVLEDLTGRYSPEQWGSIAVQAFRRHKADRILGEKNFGGDMVRAIIHGADRSASYSDVTASRGKTVRAEPVAALYERGLMHHVGRFPAMEDEMTNFTTAGYLGGSSPNRADAMVWGATDLIVDGAMALGVIDNLKEEQAEYMKQKERKAQFNKVLAGDTAAAVELAKVETPGDLAKPAVADNTLRCPQCNAITVARIPGGYRCGSCAHQFSLNPVVQPPKPMTRTDFLKGA